MILQKLMAAAGVLTKAGKLTMFADSADNLFKTKDSAGNVKVLGNGIKSFVKVSGTGAEGTFDTYRLTRDDNATTDIQVYNGADGRAVTSISAPATPGLPGATDAYTINYSKAPLTSTFTVYNGKDGVIQTVNGKTGTSITLNAADVGAIASSEKGAANGVATLGGDGKVPAAQLPAFVDDVLEFANLAAFPATGESGKIYVAIDTGRTFRWSGSTYVEISAAPVTQVNGKVGNVTLVTSDIAEGTNLYFTAQRVRDTVLTSLSVATNAVISATDSVISAFGKLQAQISAINTFLGGADPFPQYTTDAEATSIAQGRVTAHEQAADPHTQYTTAAEASAAASGAVSAHEAAGDPHPQYTTAAEVAALLPAQKLMAKISTLFASPANSTAVTVVLSLSIPANYLTAGKTFDFDLEGTQSQSAAATNVVGAIFVNGAQLVSAAVAGGTAAQTNRSLRMKGGIMWNGSAYLGNITVGVSGILPVGNANVAGVAVAAGTAHTIDFRVQTSTANAANIIRALAAVIQEL